MISFKIPSDRVHQFIAGGETETKGGATSLSSGATSLPSRPRISGSEEPIIGGSVVADRGKYYVAVSAAGNPLTFKGHKSIFEAKSPMAASIKFFNSRMKTRQFSPGHTPLPAELSGKDSSFKSAFQKLSARKLSQSHLIRIAEAGGGKVKNYIVKYVPNLNPNQMEEKNQIVVLSKASEFKGGDIRPEGLIDFEAYASI